MFPLWERIYSSPQEEPHGAFVAVQIVGRLELERLARDHSDVRSAVDTWVAEVGEARWGLPADIKVRYPSASLLANNRVIFNLKGTKYRVDTTVAYKTGKVVVKRAGTHAEYSKWDS